MRLEKAKSLMDSRVDAGVVLKPENIFYLTGFYPTAFAVLVLGESPYLAVSEMDAALAKPTGIEIKVVKSFKSELKFKGRVGIEKQHTTVGFAEKFLNGCDIFDLKFIDEMRQVKDKTELELIKKAIAVTENVLEDFTVKEITERNASAQITYDLNKTAKTAFSPIVATGLNSAVPHHTPTETVISESSPLIVDLGARVGNYNCDMTRTFSTHADEKFREVYRAVCEAQLEGIKHLQPGASAKDCDKAVRKVLSKYGFEKYFIHSTGHGVGLDVHEAPRVSQNSSDVFKEGMVVCIEPGVYIPGWGGVRIEDMVLIGKKPQILTSFPKLDY